MSLFPCVLRALRQTVPLSCRFLQTFYSSQYIIIEPICCLSFCRSSHAQTDGPRLSFCFFPLMFSTIRHSANTAEQHKNQKPIHHRAVATPQQTNCLTKVSNLDRLVSRRSRNTTTASQHNRNLTSQQDHNSTANERLENIDTHYQTIHRHLRLQYQKQRSAINHEHQWS